MYLLPFVKYPADPSAIGHTFTIVTRGQLYLAMVGSSLVLLGLAVYPGFDPGVLWKFRWYSILNQLLIWTSIALVFGALLDRFVGGALPAPQAEPEPERETVGAS